MTIQEEDILKKNFILQMNNKYDYILFKQFCLDNSFEVTPFVIYAGIVEPMVPPNGEIITSSPKPCGTCGGGKVL